MNALKNTTPWRMLAIAVTALVVIWLVLVQSGRTTKPFQEASFGRPGGTAQENKDRPLVLYAYAESETARLNLDFFLAKGLHGAADFVFVLNGATSVRDRIPARANIRVVERNNTCYDLGSMGEVLRHDGLWTRYRRFVTMNASIRGPFLPVYSAACWTDVFLDRLSRTTKLVGTTVNCAPVPHVQSMLWATDAVSMGLLLDPALAHARPPAAWAGGVDLPVGMSFCHKTMKEAIYTEIETTGFLRSQGYEVDALMTAFAPASDVDDYCRTGTAEDILYDGKYYGSNIHPYETVFIKANRNIDPQLLAKMTEWHLGRPIDSWTTCGSH